MTSRRVSVKMIQDTVLKSERDDIGQFSRLLAFKSFRYGVLKVVYIREKSVYYIVSVIWHKVNKNI